MPTIAIVGAGISALHLGLRLQQAGVPTTIYTERDAEELAAGPPLNFVVRFAQTRERERTLGVEHWDSPDYSMYGVHLSALGELPLGFYGRLSDPGIAVDFRIYLPRLLSDYAERGGAVEPIRPDAEAVARLADRHDLVVVATGRRSIAALFPPNPDRSPYTRPQRMLCAGFYTGIEPLAESALHYQLCPGVGEIFSTRFLISDGVVHGINIEAIPGGPLEPLSALSYEEDPAAFRTAVLAAITEHAPPFRERIDEAEFDLAHPNDLLQGGITPTVRTGWAALPGGTYALAVGDAWVLNDPIVGQGANLGSRNAFTLADAIMAGPPYDEDFCRRTEDLLWEVAGPVTAWSNAFLQPPPEHAIALLGAASRDQRVADAFIDNFNDPVAMWQLIGSPERTTAWLSGFGHSAPAAQPRR